MKTFIEKCDFLSHKVTLTFNEKGDIGYKTFIGGIISLISIIISFACITYFIIHMFLREDFTIIQSTEIDPYVNLTNSNKLPFLLRLTNTYAIPYENDEKLYYITASIWFGGTNETLSYSAKQYSQSIKVEKCDINKHFSDEYKDYFKNIQDLNSYYCLSLRNSSETIYGVYGSVFPFSYYSITLRFCKNTTENNNSCYPINQIKEIIDHPYLSVIFIDYTINSLNNKHVNDMFLRKERYQISPTIYKRIWLYFEKIKYTTDKGYILPKNDVEYFHSYKSIRTDFNENSNGDFFCTLTILNDMKYSTYIKVFPKIQDYLATIGGLVKVITLISSLMNYNNSQNSYYLKIVKDFIIENKNMKIEIKQNKNSVLMTSIINNKYKSKNNEDQNSVDALENRKTINMNNIPKLTSSFHLISNSLSTKVLPSFFSNKKHSQTLSLYKKFINNRLNVINILKRLETIEIGYGLEKKSLSSPKYNDNFKNYKLKISTHNKES